MPEMVVYLKSLILGFVASEVWRCAYQIGIPLANKLHTMNALWSLFLQVFFAALIIVYAFSRGVCGAGVRLGRSRRIDLLITVGIGAACDWFLIDSVAITYLKKIDDQALAWCWAAAFLLLSALVMLTPLVSALRLKLRRVSAQLYFMSDKEIDDSERDCLFQLEDARTFAKTVLASNTGSGLVFGVEGPWGVGKTSFLKLAQDYWESTASASIIVFRFEPLRYAGEPDLTERFIKELLTVVQSKVFAPEFKMALSRYSKMLKGKAEFSVFGLKMSFEPTTETVDQLLKDVDLILQKTNRKLIVIVEDLDRIEPKAISNVLFTVRRTFALAQATYILCYDTENLIAETDEGAVSREFLEKFINVKFSILLDSALIIEYLKNGWRREHQFVQALTPDREPILGELLNDLAGLLGGAHAVQYMRLVGNLRKIKRFINAIVSMQLERLDISITDFYRGDVINLVLLNMNYPGLFRQVYAEETEGRMGIFSKVVSGESSARNNTSAYLELVKSQEEGVGFLLEELFSMRVRRNDSARWRVRAFCNDSDIRSLEKYLMLIVRHAVPDPVGTFKLYQDAVDAAVRGDPIEGILAGRGFELSRDEIAHEKFWVNLVGRCNNNGVLAAKVLDAVVDTIPRYMLFRASGGSLRCGLVVDVARLLDIIAWNAPRARNVESDFNAADRIFGKNSYAGTGIVERIMSAERDVLKWYDVLRFRIECSPEKNKRYSEIYKSLCAGHDEGLTGKDDSVLDVDRECLRVFSQHVFSLFYQEFVLPGKNFFEEVAQLGADRFLGDVSVESVTKALKGSKLSLDGKVAADRNAFISFVVDNLSSASLYSEEVRGCGFYDVEGADDKHGIASLMNDYLFDVCFCVDGGERNLLYFIDFCMCNFFHKTVVEKTDSSTSESGSSFYASKVILSLDLKRLTSYWKKQRGKILSGNYLERERKVFTHDFIRSYKGDLQSVCDALDEFCEATPSLPHQPLVT